MSTLTAQPGTMRRLVPGLLLALVAVSLSMLGLTILMSIGQASAQASGFAAKQAVWLALSLCCCAAAALVDLERLRSAWWLVALVTVGLLLAVFIPGVGHKVNGATRWIRLDFIGASLQVSDFAKVGGVFVLAHWLAGRQRLMGTFRDGFAIPIAGIGLVCALILLEPDFGTTALFGAVGFTMLFLAGARLRYLVPTVLLGIAGFAVAVINDPVRLRRILAFLDLEGNKGDAAYQLWQGILAFGSGGLYGVGLGNGRQQMAFLPEAQTDFILPIVGEELGLVATLGVVVAFLLVFGLGFWHLRRAPNLFHFLVAAGALLFVTGQALINVGVTTGLLPTKGMSLPFVSYGGSNLVAMFTLVGLVLNGFWRWNRIPVRRDLEL